MLTTLTTAFQPVLLTKLLKGTLLSIKVVTTPLKNCQKLHLNLNDTVKLLLINCMACYLMILNKAQN